MTSPLNPPADAIVLDLPGLEADNLLAFLALLGLLRALETARPEWCPRASWNGPPWAMRLHLAEKADQTSVARAADEGTLKIAASFDVDGKHNVDFNRGEYQDFAKRVRGAPIAAALAGALTVKCLKNALAGCRPRR